MINVEYPAGRAGQIQVVDGLLDGITDRFIARMQYHWGHSFQGSTIGGVDQTIKLSEDLHYRADGNISWERQDQILDDEICVGLTSAISIYRQQYRHLDRWVNVTDSGFQVQRYAKNNGFYRPHVDSFPHAFSAISERVLGCVIYLNDVRFGGETHFPLHEVKIVPKAGRIALFPAVFTHPHESCVPITEDKWIISTFILNPEAGSLPREQEHDHHHEHEEPELIMGPMPKHWEFEDAEIDE